MTTSSSRSSSWSAPKASNWFASSASSGRRICVSAPAHLSSAALPVRRLPKDQVLYERRNGHFILQVTGHPEFGVPFGQDRLVPIFLATLAVRQKSQLIRFRTAAEMLESFGIGMHTGGKEYRRLVEAFERIFGATIFFGTHDHCNQHCHRNARRGWPMDRDSPQFVLTESGCCRPQPDPRTTFNAMVAGSSPAGLT
jgi:hypothetical protein